MSNQENPLVISFLTIRKVIGILAIILPAILIVGNRIFGCDELQNSISHYYYTQVGDLFVGTLCAIAMFLMAYRGYDGDNIYTNLAGIFALCIALCPTTQTPTCNVVLDLVPEPWSDDVHLGSAFLFFITLTYISLFRFRRGNKLQKEKRIENSIHLVCGIVMFIAILDIVYLMKLSGKPSDAVSIFWQEWVALAAFGISWIVKGEVAHENIKVVVTRTHPDLIHHESEELSKL